MLISSCRRLRADTSWLRPSAQAWIGPQNSSCRAHWHPTFSPPVRAQLTAALLSLYQRTQIVSSTRTIMFTISTSNHLVTVIYPIGKGIHHIRSQILTSHQSSCSRHRSC